MQPGDLRWASLLCLLLAGSAAAQTAQTAASGRTPDYVRDSGTPDPSFLDGTPSGGTTADSGSSDAPVSSAPPGRTCASCPAAQPRASGAAAGAAAGEL